MELIKLLMLWMLLFAAIWLFLGRKKEVWRRFTSHIENCRERTIYMVLFLLIIFSQGWMVFMKTVPISSDEVYTMSGAAFFAGYDWSAYMHMKKFYNFGYTMLLAPIYKILRDPVAIYRAMLFCNMILHALMVMVVYRIMRVGLKNSKCFSIAAVLVSTCNPIILFFRGFIYNEMPLCLAVWLIILLVLELIGEEGKRRIILSVLLGMVLAYTYIIHSRCIVIYAALAVVALLFFIVYKKWIAQPVSFALAFFICFCLEKRLLNYVQERLYLQDSDIAMRNSVEYVVTGEWRYQSLTTLDGIKDIFMRFFSLAGTMTIETGGILTIATVVILYYLVKNIKSFRQGKEDKRIFFLLLFSMICLWGMVAAIAITGASNGKMRFLAYTRYFMPFIGPFLLLGLSLMKQYKKLDFKWIAFWSAVLTAAVGMIYVFYMYPILLKKDMAVITSFYFFMAFAKNSSQLLFTKDVFVIALGLLVLFTMGLLFLYRKKQMIALCAAVMIFSGALFWRIEERKSWPSSERRFKITDAAYHLIQNDELSGSGRVYCAGTDYYKKSLLVKAYDKDIVYDLSGIELDHDAVMIADHPKYLLEYKPEYIYQMDNNEWIGVWDKDLSSRLAKQYQPYTEILEE